MAQTAVEWLAEQFEKIVFYSEEAKEHTIKQAKEMEKQQQGYSESDLKQAFAYNNRLNSEQSFKDWFLLFKNK